jgi:hypothetical protein
MSYSATSRLDEEITAILAWIIATPPPQRL